MHTSICKSFAAVCFSIAIASVTINAFAGGKGNFPTGPNLGITPGEVCTSADEYRYPERIAYCKRAVEPQLKNDIIKVYDDEFGFNVGGMPRTKFKIDHFIPLCMGGGNNRTNLWPQHESVYKVTDPLEPALCDKMAKGKILQAEAMDLIRRAKLHLEEVPEILARVQSL